MSDSDILSQGEDIVDRGDVEELRRFVTVNSHTASPLLKRASFFNPTGYGPNRGDVAKVLLELGADVDYQGDEYGRLDTPLHTAASFNTVEV
ncbi:MAG: ankyrin repeat domain-containing protein, partial [Gemmatimonadetes bacterium]|nr:ankyrin repeat domain-containing protein [Gemmatimonadota bacterium]